MAEKQSKIGFKIKLTSETSEKLKQEESKHVNQTEVDPTSNVEVLSETSQTKLIDSICLQKEDEILAESNSAPTSTVTETESKTSEENNSLNINDPTKSDHNEGKLQDSYAEHIHYEGEIAVYTDPITKYEYLWSASQNEWTPRLSHSSSAPESSEESPKDLSSANIGFENDTHTYTDQEGSVYIWDKEKKAWFPKVDDDFLANYQMSYGFVDNTTPAKEVDEEAKKIAEKETEAKALKRKGPPEPPKWFDVSEEQNTNVYVSNLPLDITEEEFVDVMQKCGLVMRDPVTQKMKIKLYTKPNSKQLKGDALCTYIKIESVDLALKILDGSTVKQHRIQVQKAKFQMKGNYDPTLKPKKKRRKDKDKLKKMQEKLFDWRPEKFRGERSKHEKVVIIKNVFEPSIFDTEVQLILEYQQDLREECAKCGEVKKVVIYDRHPQGVAQVSMKEPEDADNVVKLINGRWFGKRQLTAEIWDGKTRYKMEETDADLNKRLGNWVDFLEDPDTKKIREASEAKNANTVPDGPSSPIVAKIDSIITETASEVKDTA